MVEHAVNQLTDSNPGLHCLIVYDDLITLREFYSYYIQQQIEEKEEMVQINPFYETTDSVRETLSTGYKAIDVEKYENKEKRLVIVDSLEKYLGKKDKAGGFVGVELKKVKEISYSNKKINKEIIANKVKDNSNWWHNNEQMINYAKKMGNTTLSILADMGAFSFMGKSKDLYEYELSLPKHFDLKVKGFCIYNHKDFDRLSERQKQRLVKHHSSVIKIAPH
jgi:hypothetical protein